MRAEGGWNHQIGQRGEYSRRVDVGCDLAVGHAEGSAAVDVHFETNCPAFDQPIHNLARCLEGLVPQDVAGCLTSVVEAETTIAVAEVERVVVALGAASARVAQRMAPGV